MSWDYRDYEGATLESDDRARRAADIAAAAANAKRINEAFAQHFAAVANAKKLTALFAAADRRGKAVA